MFCLEFLSVFFLFVSPNDLKGTQRLVEVEIIQNGFLARGNNLPAKNRLKPLHPTCKPLHHRSSASVKVNCF